MPHPTRLRLAAPTLAALLAAAAPMRAADGDPLGGGTLAFDLGGTLADAGSAVAVQPDGKVVVAGTVATGAGGWTLALARFLPDGSLDGSFGSAGKVVDPFAVVPNQSGAALLATNDGKLLVAGSLDFGTGDQDFYVGRLLDSGAPDTAFGPGGTGMNAVAFDFGGDDTDTLAAMTLDRNGRILLAGSVDVSASDIDFGVARLTAGGLLDPDFSIDGVQSVAVSAGGPDLALAIAYGNTGIVVAGAAWSTAQGGNFDFALARLAGDGALDPGFGTGGTVQINWDMGGNHNDIAWAIGVWPDGEIVAASDVASGADSWMWMLHRYSASGTYLDGIFGTYCGGLAPPCSPAPQDSPRAMLLQGDGKLLVAGFGLGAAGDSDFGLMRRYRDLSPDNLFGGGDGQLTLDFALGGGAHRDHATAMAFDRDGRIVVAGSAEWSGLDTDFAWARFDSSYIFADGFDWPGGSSRWSATVP